MLDSNKIREAMADELAAQSKAAELDRMLTQWLQLDAKIKGAKLEYQTAALWRREEITAKLDELHLEEEALREEVRAFGGRVLEEGLFG